MKTLAGKVALVTGASRGVGKGVALGLGEAGATVYITGRTVEEGRAAVDLPGTIQQTADEVTQLGGRGIALRCDHRKDFDLSNSESPQFIGRAVAGLAHDPALLEKSGQVFVAAALALEYGFTDIDGKQPRPLTPQDA